MSKTGLDTQFLCISNGQFTYLIYLLPYLEEHEEGGGEREFVAPPPPFLHSLVDSCVWPEQRWNPHP